VSQVELAPRDESWRIIVLVFTRLSLNFLQVFKPVKSSPPQNSWKAAARLSSPKSCRGEILRG
jgi:hypothetical protein